MMQKGTTFKTTIWTPQVSPLLAGHGHLTFITNGAPQAASHSLPGGDWSIRWCTVYRMLALRSSIT